jgi:hypothetical protein
MPATGLNINTVFVTFTPSGGTTALLTRLTKSDIDGGVQNVTFSGDGDLFNTFEGTVMQVPTVTLASGNVSAIMGSVAGLVGTLAFVWPDARNGHEAGSFAISWDLSNALLSDKSASASHAAIATGSNTFSSFSSDGTTNPLAFTIL